MYLFVHKREKITKDFHNICDGVFLCVLCKVDFDYDQVTDAESGRLFHFIQLLNKSTICFIAKNNKGSINMIEIQLWDSKLYFYQGAICFGSQYGNRHV